MAHTAAVMAQPLPTKDIYTCIDASGKRLTADRPIAQCADREQRVLGPTGVERGRLGPAMSEMEMAQRLEQRRQEQLVQQRTVEQRRRDAALLARYPDRLAHDTARRHALLPIEEQQARVYQGMMALDKDIQLLKKELDSVPKDASKIPANLSDALPNIEKAQQEQKAQMMALAQEAQRINQRFDAELVRLQLLWLPASSGGLIRLAD